MKNLFCFFIIVILAMSGCGLNDAIRSVSTTVNQIDSTGGRLVARMRDTLTSKKSQQQFDSLVSSVGSSAVRGLRDTLTNDYSKRQLDSLVSGLGGNLIGGARDTLTSMTSQRKINAFLNNVANNLENQLIKVRNELLDTTTLVKVGSLREELIGQKLKKAIDSIIASAVDTFSTHLKAGIQPQVKNDIKEVQQSLTDIILEILGGMLLIAVVIIYLKYRIHLKLNKVLLHQIDMTPNQKFYDELTQRIQRNAIDRGVETTLRKVLSTQGINPPTASEHDARNRALSQKLGAN